MFINIARDYIKIRGKRKKKNKRRSNERKKRKKKENERKEYKTTHSDINHVLQH